MEKSLAPGLADLRTGAAVDGESRAISREDALATADSPTNLLWLLENAGLSEPSAAGKPAGAQPAVPGNKDADVAFSEFLLNI